MIGQGDVWWADLGEPSGSAPGWRRPVLIVQCDALNRSRIATVVCVPLTRNLKWAKAPGNVLLKIGATGLESVSVANALLVLAVDKSQLIERVGRVSDRTLRMVLAGLDAVLGR